MVNELEKYLLYDGMCEFCNSSVQFLIRHDRKKILKFSALQGKFSSSIMERHPELQEIDSVVYLEIDSNGKEHVFIRSSAAIKLSQYLGGWWSFFGIFVIVPRPIRDFFYDLFARYRYRFFGKYDSCILPSGDVRSRFID